MESKRNKHGQTVVTMDETERVKAQKALQAVCALLNDLDFVGLSIEQAKALAGLAEILDI